MAPNDPNSMYTNYASSDPSAGQPPSNWPGVPYRLDYTSDPAQMTEFGGALQQTLARLKALGSNAAFTSTPQAAQSSGSSQAQTMPDYNSLLRMYGVSQPTIRQSPFLSNDFMQAHPVLGGALNNALTAAALTPDSAGPSGVGSGISRALQGVMGVQPYQHQFQMQQQEAPLQYAEALSKLYGSTAQAQMMQAHANYFNSMPGERAESAQLRYLAQQQKLGQPVHTSDGRLLGYIGADGFQSTASLGIPDEASTSKPGGSNPSQQYSKAGRIQSLVAGGMPVDKAIAQAEQEFVVNPQNAINAGRQPAIDNRQTTSLQQNIYTRLDSDNARTNARYDKLLADPMTAYNPQKKAEAEANRQAELKANSDFAQQQLGRLLGQQQNSQSAPTSKKGGKKSAPQANTATASNGSAPPRPANVPADYTFDANGSQGAGWYKPTK